MEGSFNLIDDVIRPASDQNRYGLGVLATGDEGHTIVANLPLLHDFGLPKVGLCNLINVAYDVGTGGLAKLLDVGEFDPADSVNAFLGQVVLDKVIDTFLA